MGGGSGDDVQTYCPPGQWTTVLTYAGMFGARYECTFTGIGQGKTIEWERHSGSPPFYTTGTHDTHYTFGAWLVSPYTDIRFKPSVEITSTAHAI
jgi:hypothetical protein